MQQNSSCDGQALPGRKRSIRLDVIRCVAVLSVVAVHFFNYSGYFETPLAGKRLYAFTVIQAACMICVPLFLLLTGYLMGKKTLCKKFYSGIMHTLIVYVLTGILFQLLKKYYLSEPVSLKRAFLDILGFRGSPYAWYLEMYVGLFLLIPFLNILWDHLDSRRKRLVLIGTLLFCTALPAIFNYFDWFTPDFWQMPSHGTDFSPLLPARWVSVYPLTYYFIGAYLRDYGFPLSSGKAFLLFIGAAVLFGTYHFYRAAQGTFVQNAALREFYSLEYVIESVLLFGCILNVRIKNPPGWIRKSAQKISVLSLGIYLCSALFDRILYPVLCEKVPAVADRLFWFPVMVLSVFVLSAVLSQILEWLIGGTGRLIAVIRRKRIPAAG